MNSRWRCGSDRSSRPHSAGVYPKGQGAAWAKRNRRPRESLIWLTISDHLGKSAVRYSPCPGYSRSTIVADGRSPGGLYEPGDACVAPTQIYRTHRAWTLPIGTRFVPLRGVIVIIWANLRFGIPPCRVFAVNNRGRRSFTWRCLHTGRRMRRPYTDLSTPPRVDASHWYPFRSSAGRHRHNLGKSAVRDSPVSGIRGQQPGSAVVHLEVFTHLATHASPLHRFIEPTAPGMHPSAPVSFLRMGDSGKGDSLV